MMLESEFKNEALKATNDRNLIDNLWQEIATAYNHPARHYHNLTHLESVLTELSKVRAQIIDWQIIVFSIAFHDIVYDTQRHDNEEQSSIIAVDSLRRLNLTSIQQERCRNQILATKGHNLSPDSDANYLTDADLSILGAEGDTYLKYSEQIRQEYSFYSDELYNPGRAQVLEHFISQASIYKTEYFSRHYEIQARQNIANEILRLT